MIRFTLNRLLQSVFVLFIMSFCIYGLMGLMPGDPIDLMISATPNMTSEDADRLRALYGLDLPLTERYVNWLTAALQGDLGFSRLRAQPVMDVLLPALGNTAILVGVSFILALSLAIPIGIYGALRPYSKTDYAINLFAFAGVSIPSFWQALLLIMVFAVLLGWLPAGGMGTLGDGNWGSIAFLILPIANLTINSVGGHTRYMRAAMIETMRQDFIRTARAKGIGEKKVVFKHALRNALMPVVTIIALDFGNLFSGALITETIFAYPGMGKIIFDSVMGNDFNLALVALLFATFFTLLGNFLADVAYAKLDPRITIGKQAS